MFCYLKSQVVRSLPIKHSNVTIDRFSIVAGNGNNLQICQKYIYFFSIKCLRFKMEVAFDVNELEGMKRAELQKLCKSVGIKANMKVCDSCTQSKDQSVVV